MVNRGSNDVSRGPSEECRWPTGENHGTFREGEGGWVDSVEKSPVIESTQRGVAYAD